MNHGIALGLSRRRNPLWRLRVHQPAGHGLLSSIDGAHHRRLEQQRVSGIGLCSTALSPPWDLSRRRPGVLSAGWSALPTRDHRGTGDGQASMATVAQQLGDHGAPRRRSADRVASVRPMGFCAPTPSTHSPRATRTTRPMATRRRSRTLSVARGRACLCGADDRRSGAPARRASMTRYPPGGGHGRAGSVGTPGASSPPVPGGVVGQHHDATLPHPTGVRVPRARGGCHGAAG